MAATLNNLAGLLRVTGRYAEAEPLFRRMLAIMEQALPGHPNTRTGAENYARCLEALGNHAEAAALCARYGLEVAGVSPQSP